MEESINNLNKAISNQITMVVKGQDGEIVREIKPIRTNFVRAVKIREELEKRFPYPKYEILEFLSDEEEYIYTEVIAGRQKTRRKIKEDMLNSLKGAPKKQINDDKKSQQLNDLKNAYENNDFTCANKICKELHKNFSKDLDVAKMVAAVYSLQPEKLEEGIDWLTDLVETEDPDIYSILAGLHSENNELSEAAIYYEKAAGVESDQEQRARYMSRAAYTFWQDKQFNEAVRVGEEAQKEYVSIGKKDAIEGAKNSLSYYYAELGDEKNLDKALEYCLELLGLSIEIDYVKEIETRDFPENTAQILDTLGRVLESKDKLMEALHVLVKAKQLDPKEPILLENFKRVHDKIKKL